MSPAAAEAEAASAAPAVLRLALAGAGAIGRRHIALMQAHPETALAALADPAPASVALAAQLGVPRFVSLAELLAARASGALALDAVILATPNALHVEDALACARAGLPVLIEKPVAHTLEAGRELVRVQAETGVPMLVGHHRRHSAAMAAAQAVIRSGRLGRIVSVMGSAQFSKPAAYFEAAPWRTAPGGGPVLINLIHDIDNLRMLCGDIVQVQAMGSSAVRGHAVEDSVVIALRFASGALGSFMLSDGAAAPWSWEQTSGENADYARYAQEDCYAITGTQGALAVPTLRTWLAGGEASWWQPMRQDQIAVPTLDPLVEQLTHFCALVRGQASSRVSVEQGLHSLRVVDAVQRAMATGACITLD